MRSDTVTKGKQQAPHRSLLNALGLTPEEMETLRVILEKMVANSARLAGEEQKQ